jgi:hypothetical protein
VPLKAKGEAAEARVSAARSAAARSAAARSAAARSAAVVAASGRQSGEVWRRECRHRDPTVRRRTDRRPRSLAGLNPPGWETLVQLILNARIHSSAKPAAEPHRTPGIGPAAAAALPSRSPTRTTCAKRPPRSGLLHQYMHDAAAMQVDHVKNHGIHLEHSTGAAHSCTASYRHLNSCCATVIPSV